MSSDPWRVEDPIRPVPSAPRGERINVGEDMDDDLRREVSSHIRCSSGSITITSLGAITSGEAIRRLVLCLFDLWDVGARDLFDLERIGASTPDRTIKSPDSSALLEAEGYAVSMEGHDSGLAHLIRLLKAAERRHPEVLKEWGVVAAYR